MLAYIESPDYMEETGLGDILFGMAPVSWKMKWCCFRPLLCILFRLNCAKQTPGTMRLNYWWNMLPSGFESVTQWSDSQYHETLTASVLVTTAVCPVGSVVLETTGVTQVNIPLNYGCEWELSESGFTMIFNLSVRPSYKAAITVILVYIFCPKTVNLVPKITNYPNASWLTPQWKKYVK